MLPVPPAGIRRNGKNLLKSEFMTEATECPLVHSALEDARTMRGFESGKLTIATLIAADREISGVIKIVVPVQGKDEGFLERVETRLENLAGPVALALKKPALYAQAVMDGLTGPSFQEDSGSATACVALSANAVTVANPNSRQGICRTPDQ